MPPTRTARSGRRAHLLRLRRRRPARAQGDRAADRRAQGRAHLPRRLRDLPQRTAADAARWSARRCTSWTTSSASRWSRRAPQGNDRACRSSSSATSSATTSARPASSWTTQAQIISYEEYTPYGSTSYQAVRSQRQRRRSAIATPARSGTRRAGCTTTARGTTRRGWAGGPAADPAGLVDGPNLYLITKANPVRFVDMAGTESTETTYVTPAVRGYLNHHGIKFAEQVNFELLDDQGRVVTTGRFDNVFRDPRPGMGNSSLFRS